MGGFPMILGDKVVLRAIEPEDLDILMVWRNQPEFRKYFREYREINFEMQKKWFETIVLGDRNTLMFSIVLQETGELIGCCGLCYINWIHRYAELSIYIGYRNAYIDDNGYAEEACKLLFQYAFGELNLHKVWAEIYDFDEKKIELFRKLGMTTDGKLRDNYYYNGAWYDSLVFSVLKSEFLTGR